LRGQKAMKGKGRTRRSRFKGYVLITDEVRGLIREAVEHVGSKSRLAYELGYMSSRNQVNRWLQGRVRTISPKQIERMREILGKDEENLSR